MLEKELTNKDTNNMLKLNEMALKPCHDTRSEVTNTASYKQAETWANDMRGLNPDTVVEIAISAWGAA